LGLAEDARAAAEVAAFVFLDLQGGRVLVRRRRLIERLRDCCGRADKTDDRRTILASPRAVTIHRAWMSP
jgi:hypothetical protein